MVRGMTGNDEWAAGTGLFSVSGKITNKTPGWSFTPAAPDEQGMSYNEFEGYYPDKGGKLFSSLIKLDKKSGTSSYYRLSFSARAPERAYQGIDFFDAGGSKLPDLYDVIYSGDKKSYDRVFYASDKVESIRIFFQSTHGCEVSDISLCSCGFEEAVEYCDRIYKTLPALDFTAPGDAFKYLPRTGSALKSGKPWKVLMLGDSIVQDTFHSQFHALIKQLYPDSAFSWQVSMRGSTGCWHYRNDGEFHSYVADYAPDLLIIGGISNYKNVTLQEGTDAIRCVAEKAMRELGCEVLLLTAALSRDIRKENENSKFGSEVRIPGYDDPEGLQKVSESLKTGLWDLANPCYRWLFASGKPHEFYSRDTIHSGEMGKQIIGRVMLEYFKTAGVFQQEKK